MENKVKHQPPEVLVNERQRKAKLIWKHTGFLHKGDSSLQVFKNFPFNETTITSFYVFELYLFIACVCFCFGAFTFCCGCRSTHRRYTSEAGKVEGADCQPQWRNSNAQIECLAALTKRTWILRTLRESFTDNFWISCRRICLEEACSMDSSFVFADVNSTPTGTVLHSPVPGGIRT